MTIVTLMVETLSFWFFLFPQHALMKYQHIYTEKTIFLGTWIINGHLLVNERLFSSFGSVAIVLLRQLSKNHCIKCENTLNFFVLKQKCKLNCMSLIDTFAVFVGLSSSMKKKKKIAQYTSVIVNYMIH